ncbi:hypothetical protein ACOSQ2_019649 [Xanthoceras sorbifolium]
MERIHIKLGFSGKLVVDCIGRSGGLCLFWVDSINVDLLSFSAFYIDVKVGGLPRLRFLIDNFRFALDSYGLDDLGCSGSCFTSYNKRDGIDVIMERLDRFFDNWGWTQVFPCSNASSLELWSSDHRPVLLRIDDSVVVEVARRNSRRFFFEDCWADLEGCQDIVPECWDGFLGRVWQVEQLVECLSRCTGNLGR